MAPKGAEYIELAHKRAEEKKTHVSFPQLKYPSLRDEVLHPVQWLQGKAMDDGAEGFWRVHNGIYDLTDFIKRHPGGEEWLELTKGTDITEAFETHHLNTIASKMLEKYYIREAKTPRNSPFTFEEDGFYKTLKREVEEELKKIPKQESRKSDIILDSLLVTILVSSVLSLWFTNYWAVSLSYLVASFSLAWTGVAAHNYIHRKTNWRMYLFNLSLWSYRDFRVSHALSHHLYTNTLMDLEITSFEPIVNWNPRKKSFFAKLTLLIDLTVFPFNYILNWIKRFKILVSLSPGLPSIIIRCVSMVIAVLILAYRNYGDGFSLNFTTPGFFKQHYKWHDGIGFLLPLWMYFVSGSSFYDAVIMWLWINCTASLIFTTIGSNAAHHHPNIFKDGDQVRNPVIDWGMHELEAVMDRTDINGNYFKVLTFFGDHALHHIFPTLDHGYLSHLYPIFLKNCQKFKANFRLTSSFDLFIGQLKMAVKVDPNILNDTD